MSSERASPFSGLDDLSDFAERQPGARDKFPAKEVREASEKHGFVSRAAQNPAPDPVPQPATKLRRSRRSAYDSQINIKCPLPIAERFVALADRLGLPYAEVLEKALEALEKEPKKALQGPRRS